MKPWEIENFRYLYEEFECQILKYSMRLGKFKDSDFAGDLEDSKSTSGGKFFVCGSHTFLPTNWMCKKQTSV